MVKRYLFWVLVFLVFLCSAQKNTLYDDTRVSSVYITIPPDSLAVIMEDILSDHYFMARFVFDDDFQKDSVDSVGFRLRGNTSRYSKKKSFKISFNEYSPGRKYQGVKKLNLNGSHNDPTMIREKLFYELWEKSGMVQRRTSFVKLFINEVYYGLYTNIEEMDKEWLDRNYADKEGNLYKCTYPADLVYRGITQQAYKNLENSTATGGRVYDLKTNEAEDDYSGLVELITAINQPANSTYEANLAAQFHTDYFLKALAFDVASGNWDDYGYNRNNYYLYDDPQTGKFYFITYDSDNTFGVDWMNVDWARRNCLHWINTSISLPLAQRTMAVPALFNRYKQYLDTIARTIIHPDSVFPRIEELHLLITPAAVADTFRSLDWGYTVEDFHDGFVKTIDSHTPYGIKPFLELRQEYILNQLKAAGTSDMHAPSGFISIYPNPVSDHFTLSTKLNNRLVYHCLLTDLTGKTVLEFKWETHPDPSLSINLPDLPPGVYLLKITSDNDLHSIKVVKQ